MHTIRVAAGFAGMLLIQPVVAQDDTPMMVKSQSGEELSADVNWDMCSPDGIAIGGFDPVSYRQADGPVLGIEEFTTDIDGKTYRFSTQENMDEFSQDPEHYVPAYSGFCAVTLALGRVTCPEYKNFKIEGGRLLLFEVTGFTNGRTLWNSNATHFREQADGNFERLTELQ